MSEFLEASTKMYGVPLAISSQFYDRLPASVQAMCRQVDSVRRRTSSTAEGGAAGAAVTGDATNATTEMGIYTCVSGVLVGGGGVGVASHCSVRYSTGSCD